MRIGLHPGTWANAISIVLGGGGAVTAATSTQIALQYVGLAGMGAGSLLFLSGVTIDGKRWWDRSSDRTVVTPITLDDAVRYVANKSAWGLAQDHADPHLSINVQLALTDALANGDINARGRYFHKLRGGIKEPPLHPRLPLTTDFWTTAKWSAWWALNDLRPQNKAEFGDYEGYHDIRLNRDRLEALWPRPKRRARDLWRMR